MPTAVLIRVNNTTLPPPPSSHHFSPSPQLISYTTLCAGFRLKMDIFPRDIRLRANSASGDWVDVQEMIAGGSVSVSNAVGQPDEAKELLGLLVNRPARKVWGAAVRWALGIGNGNDIQLQLQALPCPASNLKKCPTLRGDNVPVMIITTFHVWCQLFDDPTAGTATPPPPCHCVSLPLLFSNFLNPE